MAGRTLIAKIPIGECACQCGQTVYEMHYQTPHGRKVLRRRFVRGHNARSPEHPPPPKDVAWERRTDVIPAKQLADLVFQQMNDRGMTAEQMALALGYRHRNDIFRLKRVKVVFKRTARQILEGIADLPPRIATPEEQVAASKSNRTAKQIERTYNIR